MAEIGVMKKLTIGGSTYTIPEYNLPIASASTLGGVKIGTGLSINSTTGVLSATGLDYDEADPIFVASVAYGITQNDINNWNSKTSNIGTITSVKTTAGAHTAINVTSGAAAFNVPTKTSHLTNDSGFLTSHQDISGKADKATTLSGYGITDAYTKTEVNGLVSGVLHYKGTKATVADVAAITSKSIGDVWHVTADGSEWAYDGNAWQELGTAIDLSGYVTTDDSRLSDARTPLAHNQALSTITGADDLKAIEALTGTSGLLKKTAANMWTLDTNTYLTGYTETDPTVPSWAKASTKPTYTAAEVGALPDTTVIPTVPTNISAFTNDSGYITSADVPEGASAYTGTISAVTSGNASAGSNNGFARGDHTHNITKTTIDTVLGTGSGTTNFYREDGTWATPAYPTAYSLGIYGTSGSGNSSQWTQAFNIKLFFKAGDNMGLTKDGNNIIFNAIIPASTQSATTGITATTTATKTTVGSSSTDYGVTAAGSGSFSATVTSHVLSFSHTHTAPTLGSKVPTVSTTSATVTITDNGHTHTLS